MGFRYDQGGICFDLGKAVVHLVVSQPIVVVQEMRSQQRTNYSASEDQPLLGVWREMDRLNLWDRLQLAATLRVPADWTETLHSLDRWYWC